MAATFVIVFGNTVPSLIFAIGFLYIPQIARIVRAKSLDELLAAADGGNFVRAGWCGCRACEDKVKEFAQATARVMDEENSSDTCIVCGKKAEKTVIFARAY